MIKVTCPICEGSGEGYRIGADVQGACYRCEGRGEIVLEESMEIALKRAVKSQQEDMRTDQQVAEDGAKFITGGDVDE